jgi:hypothetical protein
MMSSTVSIDHESEYGMMNADPQALKPLVRIPFSAFIVRPGPFVVELDELPATRARRRTLDHSERSARHLPSYVLPHQEGP